MRPVESTALLLLGIVNVVALGAAPRAPAVEPAALTTPVLALRAALANERYAAAFYTATARRHPGMPLFALVRDAERVHVARVLALFDRYGMEIPPDGEDPDKILVPASIAATCVVSAEQEQATVTFLDGIISDVNQVDVRETFIWLRNASRDKHLPAFARCAARPGP